MDCMWERALVKVFFTIGIVLMMPMWLCGMFRVTRCSLDDVSHTDHVIDQSMPSSLVGGQRGLSAT